LLVCCCSYQKYVCAMSVQVGHLCAGVHSEVRPGQ
jgi:hypothetical protein